MFKTMRLKELAEEQERDCSKHVVKLQVRFVKKAQLFPNYIAGLLRALAISTDGYCADRDATDADFETIGMDFSFTSEEKRSKFRQRVEWYLSPAAVKCLEMIDL